MDSNLLLGIVGAISALIGVLVKSLVDFKKASNSSSTNRRDDFTVTFDKMEYLLEKAEANNKEQEVRIKQLVAENQEMKEILSELRAILSTIKIDPDVAKKIDKIYEKLKDK